MRPVEGGRFSPDFLARLLGEKYGSASENELAQAEAIPGQAIDTASGMMGTIAKVPGAAALPEEMSLIDRIKMAVEKSKVKGPEGGLTNNASVYQKGGPKQPAPGESFWDKFGPKDVTGPEGEVIPLERFKALNKLLK
jgi:hypothetical protein